MATLRDLEAKVAELQATVDNEQQQVADALGGLNAEIARLEALVADGGTAEERQNIIDNLQAISDDLAATIPDAEVPDDEEPVDEEPVDEEPV